VLLPLQLINIHLCLPKVIVNFFNKFLYVILIKSVIMKTLSKMNVLTLASMLTTYLKLKL